MRKTIAGVLVLACMLMALIGTVGADPLPETGEAPAEEETQVPVSEEPQTPEPESAAPATTAPPTEPPATPPPRTQEPSTPEPTQTPTSSPPPTTEPPGTVDLRMYIYTSGDLPAAGYTVNIDSASTTTNETGLANFANLSVEQHAVRITAPDGSQCVGQMYMTRSGSTRVTDQAMGGTYGVDVERGVRELYMLVTFVPDGGMTIRTLSNSAPALPEAPQPTQSLSVEQSVKALTATFLDDDGQPMGGLGIAVQADDGTTLENATDNRGQIQIPQVPYGHYAVSITSAGAAVSAFELTLQPAAATGIAQNTGTSFVVNSATSANHLYLEFRRSGNLFTLTEASDSPIGGLDSMVLGIIVVAAVVVVIVVIVVLRRRRRRPKPAAPTRKTNYTPPVPGDDDDSLREDLPRRTGGANKFDDRSRL